MAVRERGQRRDGTSHNFTVVAEGWRTLVVHSGCDGIDSRGYSQRRDETSHNFTLVAEGWRTLVAHSGCDGIDDREREQPT